MPTISRIGPKLALCVVVAALALVGWAARHSAAQNLAQDVPPPAAQVPGTTVKGEEPKAAEPQTKPVTNSELASPLPAPGPDDRLAVPRLTAEPDPSPFNGALGIKAPAPVPVAPGDATPEAEDPEKVATAFLEQNQKLAEAHLKTLKEEADKLKARLLKVEAGIKRWDSLLEGAQTEQGQRQDNAASSDRFATACSAGRIRAAGGLGCHRKLLPSAIRVDHRAEWAVARGQEGRDSLQRQCRCRGGISVTRAGRSADTCRDSP